MNTFFQNSIQQTVTRLFLSVMFIFSYNSITANWIMDYGFPNLSTDNTTACDCGVVNFDRTISDGQHITISSIWTLENICITGTVFFDASVSMQYCSVYLGENAQIIVRYKGLRTLSSTFKGCSKMWRGIVVQDGAKINAGSSEFRDAVTAIWLTPSYKDIGSSIVVNKFIDNQHAIQIGDGATSITQLFPLRSNQFLATPGVTLLPPLQFEQARDGIIYKNCTTATMWAGSKNVFDGLRNGIWSDNSNVLIEDCSFKNTRSDGSGTDGYGMFGNKNVFTIKRCDFNNDFLGGIYQKNMTGLEVQYSKFTHERKNGIFVWGSSSPYYMVLEKNLFEMNIISDFDFNELSAMAIMRPPSFVGDNNRINDNTINVTGEKKTPMVLIDCRSPSNVSKGTLDIAYNHINVSAEQLPDPTFPTGGIGHLAAIHGIYLEGGADYYNVRTNDLNYTHAPPPNNITAAIGSLGISMVNVDGTGNWAFQNSVSSTLNPNINVQFEESSSWIKCAIHVANSLDWTLCRNFAIVTYRGIHLDGDLGNMDYSQNTMDVNYYGFLCQSNTGSVEMVDQNRHQNHWPGNYIQFSAKYSDPLNSGGETFFKFRELQVDIPANYTPANANWFNPVSPTFPSNSHCLPHAPEESMLTNREQRIIVGDYAFSSPREAWDMRRGLLLRLMQRPEWMPSGSNAEAYCQFWENSSEWKFAKVESLYRNSFKFPQSGLDTLSDLLGQLKSLNNQQALLDSLQNIDSTSIDSLLAIQQSTNATNLASVWSLVNSVRTNLHNLSIANLSLAKTYNDALPHTEVYEQNRQSVIGLAIKEGAEGVLTEAENNILRAVANQCPQIGGDIVREASWFLPHNESVQYKNEDFYSACAVPRSEKNAGLTTENLVNVSPNPASERLAVQLSKNVTGDWEIISMTGQIAVSGEIAPGESLFYIDLRQLIPAPYFLRLRTSNGEIATQKFVVIK